MPMEWSDLVTHPLIHPQELQTRELFYRPTWDLVCYAPNSCNYYPITSTAAIVDQAQDLQVSVSVDRSGGCSSLNNGDLEVMLHRRLLVPTGFFVGDALNETTVIRTREHLILETPANSAAGFRPNSINLNSPPVILFSEANSIQEWMATYQTVYAPMVADLPPNVKLETFKYRYDGATLVRLAHIFAVDEDAVLSQDVQVNLLKLFTNLVPVAMVETTLTGNQPLADFHPLSWNTVDAPKKTSSKRADDWVITLSAMEIQTFLIEYNIV